MLLVARQIAWHKASDKIRKPGTWYHIVCFVHSSCIPVPGIFGKCHHSTAAWNKCRWFMCLLYRFITLPVAREIPLHRLRMTDTRLAIIAFLLTTRTKFSRLFLIPQSPDSIPSFSDLYFTDVQRSSFIEGSGWQHSPYLQQYTCFKSNDRQFEYDKLTGAMNVPLQFKSRSTKWVLVDRLNNPPRSKWVKLLWITYHGG